MNGNNRYTPSYSPEDALTMLETIFVQNLALEASYDSTKVPIVYTGTVAPATTPLATGSIYVNTTNGFIYIATGTVSSSNWVQVNGSSGHTIQDEGVSLTARAKLNFVGANVTVTDDAGNNATVVTITGSSSVDRSALIYMGL